MSVKFEKETVREAPVPGGRKVDFAHEIGEKLTGGESQTGYLAVSAADDSLGALLTSPPRPTSNSSKQILCAQRCLHLVP